MSQNDIISNSLSVRQFESSQKKMFSLLSNSPLSEVLAPNVSALDEFIFQWNAFNLFFNQTKNENKELSKYRIESTNLSTKLFKMADILVTEQLKHRKKKSESVLCPSLEYLLQNNILDTLSVFAQADIPLGICPHILMFFVRLLNDSKTELIPHKSVHVALNKLIIICGKIPAGPYETSEIYFLSAITEHIYQNPVYLDFFLNDSYSIMNSLLLLLYSPDSQIVKSAGDSIIKLVSISNEAADLIMLEKLPFCSKILNHIINSYNEIPRSLNPQEVEISIFTFRNDSNSNFTNSIRKFLCFLKWYIFFDMLLQHSPSNSLLSLNLLDNFKQDFLESCLLPDIVGEGFESELDATDNVFLTTILISNCLRNTESIQLFYSISEFLLIPDELDSDVVSKHKNCNLDKLLFKRCDHRQLKINYKSSSKLLSATLQLIEDIFSRPSLKIVNKLVIKPLSTKSPIKQEENNIDDQSHQFRNKLNFDQVICEIKSVADEIASLPNVSIATQSFKMHNLNSILNRYATLMPPEIKLNVDTEVSDYEAYIKEAVKGIHIFITTCYTHWKDVDLKQKFVSNIKSRQDSFLNILFDNLSFMSELPYDSKLQVSCCSCKK